MGRKGDGPDSEYYRLKGEAFRLLQLAAKQSPHGDDIFEYHDSLENIAFANDLLARNNKDLSKEELTHYTAETAKHYRELATFEVDNRVGNFNGNFAMASFYADGLGEAILKDLDRAFAHLQFAGDEMLMMDFAIDHAYPDAESKTKAVEKLISMAKAGDIDAQVSLVNRILRRQIAYDDNILMRYIQVAADNGSTSAIKYFQDRQTAIDNYKLEQTRARESAAKDRRWIEDHYR